MCTYYFDTDEIFYVIYFPPTVLQKNVTQLGHWFNARAALPLSIVSQKLGIFHNNQAFYRQKGGGGKTAGRKNSNPYLGNDSQIEALVTNFSAPTTTTTATSSTTALQHANSGKQQFFFLRNSTFSSTLIIVLGNLISSFTLLMNLLSKF